MDRIRPLYKLYASKFQCDNLLRLHFPRGWFRDSRCHRIRERDGTSYLCILRAIGLRRLKWCSSRRPTGMHRDSDSRENQRDGASRRVLCRFGHLRDRAATPCCSAMDGLVEPWSSMTVDCRSDCGEASHLACDSRSRMPQPMHRLELRRRVAADRPRWLIADKRASGVRIRMMSARAGPATGCETRRSAATPVQVRAPGQGRTPLGFM